MPVENQLRVTVVKAGMSPQACLVHASLCGSAWKGFFFLFSFCDNLLPLPGSLFRTSLPGLWACTDPQAPVLSLSSFSGFLLLP